MTTCRLIHKVRCCQSELEFGAQRFKIDTLGHFENVEVPGAATIDKIEGKQPHLVQVEYSSTPSKGAPK